MSHFLLYAERSGPHLGATPFILRLEKIPRWFKVVLRHIRLHFRRWGLSRRSSVLARPVNNGFEINKNEDLVLNLRLNRDQMSDE